MFGLDPFNPSVAIAEILLLLAFAAFVGWLLGRLVLNGRINALRAAIAGKEAELADCRRSKTTRSETTVAPTNAFPRSEPVSETPVAYVPADSLLPALSHDDSPDLITGAVDSPGVVADDVALTNQGEMEVPGAFIGSSLRPDNSEVAVLSRIAARANEINFDRIGRATAAEADDLKDIVGVGPFLERKLHSLGIYTFRQVANFTKEDVDKVNSIIEFFPGRIERDNWVDQSKEFHERKYGKPNSNQSPHQ